MPSGHVDKSKPLQPLSDHAWRVLEYLDTGRAMSSQASNPGVWNRLLREHLVEQQYQGSRRVYVITAAGREKMKERP